jgi:hypothetical protein
MSRWAEPEAALSLNKTTKEYKRSFLERFLISLTGAKSMAKGGVAQKKITIREWYDGFRNLMKLQLEPMFSNKVEKIKLGEEEGILWAVKRGWFLRFWRKFNKEHGEYIKKAAELAGADKQGKNEIRKLFRTLASMDAEVTGAVKLLSLERVPFFIRQTVNERGEVIALDLIPYSAENISKFFSGKIPPNAVLMEGNWTALNLTRYPETVEYLTEVAAGSSSTFAKKEIPAVRTFEQFFNTVSRAKGSDPSKWEFTEAASQYFWQRAKFRIDCAPHYENGSIIIRVISDKMKKDIGASPVTSKSAEFNRFLPFLGEASASGAKQTF